MGDILAATCPTGDWLNLGEPGPENLSLIMRYAMHPSL
jgi:hypothetical protein